MSKDLAEVERSMKKKDNYVPSRMKDMLEETQNFVLRVDGVQNEISILLENPDAQLDEIQPVVVNIK